MKTLIRQDNDCLSSYGHPCKIIETENSRILCWYCHHELMPKMCLGITRFNLRCRRESESEYGYCRTHEKEWENEIVQRRIDWRVGLKETQINEALERFDDYVYFIICDGYVKIGHSKNPESRLAILKSQSDKTLRPAGIDLNNMKLIKKIKGGKRLEYQLHLRLMQQRVVGEWFKHDTDVAHVIESYM